MGYVYVLGEGLRVSPVKIGRSENVVGRLASIQVGYPRRLQILGTVETDDCVSLELELHLMFDHSRLQGEWFDIDGGLAVEALTSGFQSFERTVYTPSHISETLRLRRKYLGLTQGELATLVGVSRNWVSEMEKGKDTVEIGKVLTIINALGLKIEIGPI